MSRKVELPLLEDDAWTAGAREIVKVLFYQIAQSGKTYTELADETGLHVQSFKDWRSGKTLPGLDSLLRCLGCLGYSLVVTSQEDSAFAHSGYFDMEYESERQKCVKEGKQPPPRRGSPEWIEENSKLYVSDFEPTPEEIEAENQQLRPGAERVNEYIKECKKREALREEERRKLFERKRRRKKSSRK